MPGVTMRRRARAAAALASCVLLISATRSATPASARGVRESVAVEDTCDAAPGPANTDFKLKDVAGASLKLADLQGRVVVLNFWATWCVPCKAEIPDFVALQARHGEAGLQVIGISVDDSVKQLRPFIDTMKMNYPVLQGRGRNDILDAYKVSSLPVTVVIARDGTLCWRHSGPVAREALEAQIKALL